MNYSISTTTDEDALIEKAAEIRGVAPSAFVASCGSAVADTAKRVIADKDAEDRASYMAAYDAADDKEALRVAVSGRVTIAVKG